MKDFTGTPEEQLKAIKAINDAVARKNTAILARRLLWLAYCWNDKHFEVSPVAFAKKEAADLGIDNLQDANQFLSDIGCEPLVSCDTLEKIDEAYSNVRGAALRLARHAEGTSTHSVNAMFISRCADSLNAAITELYNVLPVEPSIHTLNIGSKYEADIDLPEPGEQTFDQWRNIGIKLYKHYNGTDEGLEIFNAWSKDVREYKGKDDVRGHWKAIGRLCSV